MNRGIYKITNILNNKLYVGSTAKDFQGRYEIHKYFLSIGKHHSKHLQLAWVKDGEQNFTFEIIETIKNPTKDFILSREQFWLDYYKSYDPQFGYNICRYAGSCLGVKHSEEFCKRVSERQIGEKNHFYSKNHSDETKQKMRENSYWKNRHLSKEIKQKISKARKGKFCGEENPFSKFTWELVREIREKYKNGGNSYSKISEEYGIKKSFISSIILNKSWKDEQWEIDKKYIKAKKISYGEDTTKAKLSWIKVREIRERYKNEKITFEKLAKEYGVHNSTISNIVNNISWKEENEKKTSNS